MEQLLDQLQNKWPRCTPQVELRCDTCIGSDPASVTAVPWATVLGTTLFTHVNEARTIRSRQPQPLRPSPDMRDMCLP